MERAATGITLLIVAIVVLGLVFSEPAFLFAAFSLILFLFFRYLVFSANVQAIIPTVHTERKIKHGIFRQGSDIHLENAIHYADIPALHLAFSDIIPEGALLVHGATEAHADDGSPGECTLHYTFRPMNTGEILFGGLRVAFGDPLFAETLTLTDAQYRRPELLVYPVQLFDSKSEKRHTVHSMTSIPMADPFEVQYFREYQMGDAPKSIDWKLSAKYGKIFIREYSYYRTSGQLFIIDLPDRETLEDGETFPKLKEALVCSINAETKENIDLFLVEISGGNLISAAPMPHDFNSIILDLNRLKPEYRRLHLYRTPDGARHAMHAAYIHPDQEGAQFVYALDRIRELSSEISRFTPFEQEMGRIFHRVNQSEVNLFTTFQGDDSHVRIILRQAANCGKHVHLFIPKEAYSARNESRINKLPFHSVTMV
ncbi:MAG: DUF58 domain-containing protein [Methanomicrobiaceae archaeon]|nr:DUF58 domain-containing protein [Methanomicrobiaceae archaeon]